MTPERWQAEQQALSRFLLEMEAGIDKRGYPQIRGVYEQYSAHGHLYGTFRLRVVYPPPFPAMNAQPEVYLENPPTTWVNTGDGHVYKDWGLCLGVALDSDIDFTKPDSAAQLVETIDTFLRLERIFQRDLKISVITGIPAVWPGPQRSHGPLGIYESIHEQGEPGRNAPCLCGSGKKYKACHWAQIQRQKECLRRQYVRNKRDEESAGKASSS